MLTTFCAAAPALAGGPGVPTGKWCEIDRPTEAEGWMFFRRGSKCAGATLVIQQNGDYVLSDDEGTKRCKVDPKSYFKGWADYACTYGRQSYITILNQKFTISDGELALSTLNRMK